jgi:cytochrome c peroxidase
MSRPSQRARGSRRGAVVVAATLLTATPTLAQEALEAGREPSPIARLGRALFTDQRFTNPAADYHASCSGCHATGSSQPQRTERLYADYVPQSLTAGKQTTLRNTPTILGVRRWQRFGLDGEYESLEAIIEAKLTGPMMGWSEGDRARARDAIHFTLLEETSPEGERYVELFHETYDIDLSEQTPGEALASAVRALADFARTLESTQTSAYDAFRTQNRIDSGPGPNESPQDYAGRVFGRLGNLEGRLQVKRPEGFTREAYEGFEIFFRTFGEESVGNCVACHAPPHFTDHSFHNVGISQAEYDAMHGNGAFGGIELDASERPGERYLSTPSRERPGAADLGFWNYAPSDQLDQALAAFKTPSLRNLSRTDPYMHTGAYSTLEEVVSEIVRLSRLARSGDLRSIDPELTVMRLDADDVAPLVAFLRQLDDVGPERFRYYLIHFAED